MRHKRSFDPLCTTLRRGSMVQSLAIFSLVCAAMLITVRSAVAQGLQNANPYKVADPPPAGMEVRGLVWKKFLNFWFYCEVNSAKATDCKGPTSKWAMYDGGKGFPVRGLGSGNYPAEGIPTLFEIKVKSDTYCNAGCSIAPGVTLTCSGEKANRRCSITAKNDSQQKISERTVYLQPDVTYSAATDPSGQVGPLVSDAGRAPESNPADVVPTDSSGQAPVLSNVLGSSGTGGATVGSFNGSGSSGSSSMDLFLKAMKAKGQYRAGK
jgi:hypothetical protein